MSLRGRRRYLNPLPKVEIGVVLNKNDQSGIRLSSSDGSESSSSGYYSSDYIFVRDFHQYTFSGASSWISITVCWYDKFKRFLSSQTISNSNAVNPPTYARYCRISYSALAALFGSPTIKRTA